MANVEKYDDLIIGSGIAGKFTAWTRDNRRRMAIVERGLLGGGSRFSQRGEKSGNPF